MCLLLPLTGWSQAGYSFGPTILVPQGELSSFMNEAVGFQFGGEYKFKKIRTTLNANFALNRYAKESQRFYDYPGPWLLEEVDIAVISAIRYSFIGLCFEPIKGNPPVSPFAAIGTGHSGFRSYWDLEQNAGSKDGWGEVHRLLLSRTTNFSYGVGLKIALAREGTDGRVDVVLQIMRHQGNQVRFLNPDKNPAHYNFDRRLIDTRTSFSAKSDFIAFWLGLQIRFPSRSNPPKVAAGG